MSSAPAAEAAAAPAAAATPAPAAAAPASTATATPTPTPTPTPPTDAVGSADGAKKPSKQGLKKAAKAEAKKKADAEKAAAREARDKEKFAKAAAALEESKQVVIEEDPKLPPANRIEVIQVKQFVEKRVRLSGWVNVTRKQGNLIFFELRDGSGSPDIVQVVLGGKLSQTYDAQLLHRESAVMVTGVVKANPKAPGFSGVEVQADYWQLVGPSDGDYDNRFNAESHEDVLADNRHLVHRQPENASILKLRSLTMQCFREHFFDKGFTEVTPPTIVQTQVEGGSTLFKFDYFGEPAYLTQSSQLYLETMVPSLNKVFCCMPSFRAEKSRTRRHLAEYTHFEGELGFIEYEDLLNLLEDMCVDVADRLVKKNRELLLKVNPKFVPPQKPFKRMNYADAIKYCNEHNIYKNEKTKEHFVFGDDIPEGPERKMTDEIGKPILLCRFPAAMKPFYMSRCKEDNTLTESVDLLMPGVGEIIGGSMRSWKLDELIKGFAKEGIDPTPYYWYNDLRKFGACPHGGWGLGIERYLCWILGQNHIRNVCMYPRHVGRAKP